MISQLLQMALSNAVIAFLLYLGFRVARVWVKDPAIRHALFLLVLIKLLTPPIWGPELPWRPQRSAPAPAGVAAVSHSSGQRDFQVPVIGREISPDVRYGEQAAPSLKEQPRASGGSIFGSITADTWLPSLLFALWMTGAAVSLVLAMARIARFQRVMRTSSPPDDTLRRAFQRLARELGVTQFPELRILPRKLSPALFGMGRLSRIVVPVQLVNSLRPEELETVLQHELIHFLRRDHWVRGLELVASTVYWWHPVVWWTSCELRQEEEAACDDWLLRRSPKSRRSYAEAIVKTLGMLSSASSPPALTQLQSSKDLECRILRIMSGERTGRASRWSWLAVLVLACGLLPSAPRISTAQSPPEQPAAPVSEPSQRILVVDSAGAPVSGLAVSVSRDSGAKLLREFTTDSRGELLIPANWIPASRNWFLPLVLFAEQGDRVGWQVLPRKTLPELPSGEPIRMTLTSRTRVIRGRLEDPQGRPVAGARMSVQAIHGGVNGDFNARLFSKDLMESPPSDELGQYELRVPPDMGLSLQPVDPQFVRGHVYIRQDQQEVPLIVLRPAGEIRGNVVNAATGQGLAGQLVSVQAIDHHSFPDDFSVSAMAQAALTGDDGRFEIKGLPPGTWNVKLQLPNTAEGLAAPAVEALKVQSQEVSQAVLRAARPVRLFGKLLDVKSGEAIAGVEIGYQGAAFPMSGASTYMVKTQSDGTFELFVPPGAARLYCASLHEPTEDSSREFDVPVAESFGPVNLKVGPARAFGVDAVAEPQAARDALPQMKLRLGATDKAPVRHVRIHTFVGKRTHSDMTSGHAGEEFDFIIPRDWNDRELTLVIDAAGFRVTHLILPPAPDRPDLAPVHLEPHSIVPVMGRVIDSQGLRVPNARVRVRLNIFREEFDFPWGKETTTGPDGAFQLTHIRGGDRFQVQVDAADGAAILSDWCQIEEAPRFTLPDMVWKNVNEPLAR